MNIFEQLREMKIAAEYETAKKLHKLTSVLLAAEDLVLAVEEMELPADLFTNNQSVKNVIEAAETLKKTFKLEESSH